MTVSMTIVVAAAENGVIGREGGLPWHLPADLRHFKAATMGRPIVMGRRTWESIGRALPGRLNIVVTSRPDYVAEGAAVVHGLDEAVTVAGQQGAEEIMIIGGARLYAESLPGAERLLLTRVHAAVEGDTVFPRLRDDEWALVSSERHEPDERHAHAYSFLELRRVR